MAPEPTDRKATRRLVSDISARFHQILDQARDLSAEILTDNYQVLGSLIVYAKETPPELRTRPDNPWLNWDESEYLKGRPPLDLKGALKMAYKYNLSDLTYRLRKEFPEQIDTILSEAGVDRTTSDMYFKEPVDKILSVGRSLEELGSGNWGLTKDQALHALDQLQAAGFPVSGGDVLSVTHSDIRHNYDNWSCDRVARESIGPYVERSISEARKYISEYKADPVTVLFVIVPGEAI